MKNVFHVFSRMFTKFLGERPFKSTFSAHRADTFPAAVTPDLFRGRFTRNTQQAQFPLTEHDSSCGARFFHHFRFALALCVALLAATTAFGYPISRIDVRGGNNASDVKSSFSSSIGKGFTLVDQDLNAKAGGDYIYVAYKYWSYGDAAITDIIVETEDYPTVFFMYGGRKMYYNGRFYEPVCGLAGNRAVFSESFISSDCSLNSGVADGTKMWLFYTTDQFPDRREITGIAVTTGKNNKTKEGYTTLGRNGAIVGTDGSGAVDLNEGAGSGSEYIYMHVSTDTEPVSADMPEFISDVVVIGGDDVSELKERYESQGWTVIDVDLNAGAGGDDVYIAYKKTHYDIDVRGGFITDFIIKTGDFPSEFESDRGDIEFDGRQYFRAPHYGSSYFESSGGNLNSGTTGTKMWLYFTRNAFPDNRAITDIAFTTGKNNKTKTGYTTLGENGAVVGSDGSGAMDLNSGAGGDYIYMHFSAVPAFYTVTIHPCYYSGKYGCYYDTEELVFVRGKKPDDPVRRGYTFLGWFTTADGDTPFDFDAPVTNGAEAEVYAKWQRNEDACITRAMVAGGPDGDYLKNMFRDLSFTVPDQDLNDKAGGDYIYMVYDWTPDAGPCITDFIVRTEEYPAGISFNGRGYYSTCIADFCSESFLSSECNLNNRTSGTKMWLYYTTDSFPDRRVVTDIAFTTGDSKTKDGYTTVGRNGAVVGTDGSGAVDLNEGAGSSSEYIYMHISTSTTPVAAGMPEYISDVVVFGGPENEDYVDNLKSRYESQGWTVINKDLNAGAGGEDVYMAYKKSRYDNDVRGGFITDFIIKTDEHPDQYTFGDRKYYRAPHYGSTWFESHGGNLNSRTKSGSTNMWLYFTRDPFPDKRVVTDIAFTTGDSKTKEGYTTLGENGAVVGNDGSGAMDLNDGADGDYIYMHFSTVSGSNTVSFVSGDNNIVIDPQVVVYGKTPTKPEPVRPGFKFLGWFTADGDAFDFTAPVYSDVKVYAKWQWNGGDLANVNMDGDYVARDGFELTGTLASNSRILIADKATVTLNGVTINGVSDKNNKYEWAGITCLGDCKIVLDGKNSVKGFWEDYPGIYVPKGKTLTIEGEGSLDASSNGWGAGICGGFNMDCGNVDIKSGTIVATGGKNAAGIGLGEARNKSTSCGNITIGGDKTKVTTAAGEGGPYSIGVGKATGSGSSTVGTITIGGEVTGNLAINPYVFPVEPYTVSFHKNSGTGNMDDQTFYIDYDRALPLNTFTREGYQFVGWNTKSDGSGTAYADGEVTRNLVGAGETADLYAQWWNGDLSKLKIDGSYVARNGYVLTGTLASKSKISIEDKATVTLKGVTINGVNDKDDKREWAGIACLGDCKILLEDSSTVKGFWEDYPGIYVPKGKTLTIDGMGVLSARSNGYGAGLCGGFNMDCGNVTIKGGTVYATGGKNAAGIGLGEARGKNTSCGNITIASGVTKVYATGGKDAPYSVGIGSVTEGGKSTAGTITIGGKATGNVSMNPFVYPSYTVVFDKNGGKGTMQNQVLHMDYEEPLNANTYTPARSEYAFLGWNTAADGSGNTYADGASVKNLTNELGGMVTLYAQWWNGNLTSLKEAGTYVAYDGYTLTGTLTVSGAEIVIADGATVTLDGVSINDDGKLTDGYDGLGCLGDCVILLKENSVNVVKGRGGSNGAGIYVPVDKTLTIDGMGSLEAEGYVGECTYSGCGGPGIGSGHGGGNIEIKGGNITARGGPGYSAGIGCGSRDDVGGCGDITISGGTIVAIGGQSAAGIGSGFMSRVGNITITEGVTSVTAIPGPHAPNGIGMGRCCGNPISVAGVVTVGKTVIMTGFAGNIDGNGSIAGEVLGFTGESYTVVFKANGGAGDMESQQVYFGFEQALNANAFTRDGFSFVGWNTEPDGSGTSYSDAAMVRDLVDKAGGSVTLYAQWYSGNVIDISTLTGGYTAQDGDVLTGRSAAGVLYKISIADGATVTLLNMMVEGYLACKGDCNIILAEGSVSSVNNYYGTSTVVNIPANKTLTIDGKGKLNVVSTANSIKGGDITINDGVVDVKTAGATSINCSVVTVNGGSLTATSVTNHGIATSDVTVNGGILTVTSGKDAYGGIYATNNITINGGTVVASGGFYAYNGALHSEKNIEIKGGDVTATGDSVGHGIYGEKNVSITGGTVTAIGGSKGGVGIQGGASITITEGVTSVTTVKGEGAPYSIALGSSNGTLTIGDRVLEHVVASPYTFKAPYFHDGNFYTVTFDANGGTGTMESQTHEVEHSQKLPATAFTRKGYGFAGWNTEPNGKGVTYYDQEEVTNIAVGGENLTLYAQWWDGDLSKLTVDGRYLAQDGMVLRGTLPSDSKISIADKATITLDNANIEGIHWQRDIYIKRDYYDTDNFGQWAGLTCEGDCNVLLVENSVNNVKGFHGYYPGIFIPENKTLTIDGKGTLNASSGEDFLIEVDGTAYSYSYNCPTGRVYVFGLGYAAGIGSRGMSCGNIVIKDGVINAKGGVNAVGIGLVPGSSSNMTCGDITISGGVVNATSLNECNEAYGVGIGLGNAYSHNGDNKLNVTFGNITINGGIVNATGSNIAIGRGSVTKSNVTFGDITITDGVTKLTATSVNDGAQHSIGFGSVTGSTSVVSNGKITVAGVETGSIETNPFVYAMSYNVAFDDNGGNGNMDNLTLTYDEDLRLLPKNSFTRQGYMFMGWNTAADGSGTAYADEAEVQNLTTTPKATVTLYAQWKQPYTVVFNANGGSGSMESQQLFFGDEPVALSKNSFTREGYTFVGWNTKADGEGLAYSNREKVQDLVSVSGAEITLYAQWNKTVQSLAAIVISQDGNGKLHATINGDYAGKDKVSIEREVGIDVAKVELDRSFSTAGYSTITLPFGIKGSKVTGAKQFLRFIGVKPNEQGVREVHMKRAWCDYDVVSKDIDAMDISNDDKEKAKKSCKDVSGADVALSAYTPYVVQMGGSSLKFDASAAEPVTLVKTPDAADTVVGNWVFRGTLAPKVWEEGDPEIGNAYGYVAETGDFMKVGDNSSIGALRSYLVYKQQPKANVPGMSNIQANFSTETLPANMDVVIVDDDENGKEHRTVIGKFNTQTGEFKFTLPENGTFDVKGRRVNETRSVGKGRKAKGVYYGRKK